ncbi:hypothetical protein MtrunA17_Chr1g0174811 [Medicago truncatula]|uniref:Uncharacterized protein n=1 Tax=Medicago truncatula TaxID=3880 RepID=A0A396JLS8_MEDTR|nr:hypothetical protein MtrunA17_Chr1g0174811 [Medicago truncatula]
MDGRVRIPNTPQIHLKISDICIILPPIFIIKNKTKKHQNQCNHWYTTNDVFSFE